MQSHRCAFARGSQVGMFSDLLSRNPRHLDDDDDPMATADDACRKGDLFEAIAVLSAGYERGGPSALLDRAYMCLQSLVVSRHMLRGADAIFGSGRALASLDQFADRYETATIDRLIVEMDAYVLARRGQAREPSEALLHLAQTRLAKGAPVESVLSALPTATSTVDRARILSVQAYLASGDFNQAQNLLQQTGDPTDESASMFRSLGRWLMKDNRHRKAANYFNRALLAEATLMPDQNWQTWINYAKRSNPSITGSRLLSDMLNDLLPANTGIWQEKDFETEARSALKSGNFPRAAAILATSYERGGPAVHLEQAYTYLHYLLISRRMLRRGAAHLGGDLGNRMLGSFSAHYGDMFLDRLKTELESHLISRLGEAREPSGALLLMAEMRMADGEPPEAVLPILPRASSIKIRARFAAARAHLSAGNESAAENLMRQTIGETDSAAMELRTLGHIAQRQGRTSDAGNLFDRSLRATFAPEMPSDIAPGEVRFLSTILTDYDVYASTAGFTVIKKTPSQVGVILLGDRLFEVQNTPGYRQWRLVKRVLGRIVDFNRLRAWTLPQGTRRDMRAEPRRARLAETARRLLDTLRQVPGVATLLSALKAGLRTIGTGSALNFGLKGSIRRLPHPPKPRLKQRIKALVLLLMRTVVGRWIAAREVPATHQTQNVQEIFRIIGRIENAQNSV